MSALQTTPYNALLLLFVKEKLLFKNNYFQISAVVFMMSLIQKTHVLSKINKDIEVICFRMVVACFRALVNLTQAYKIVTMCSTSGKFSIIQLLIIISSLKERRLGCKYVSGIFKYIFLTKEQRYLQGSIKHL